MVLDEQGGQTCAHAWVCWSLVWALLALNLDVGVGQLSRRRLGGRIFLGPQMQTRTDRALHLMVVERVPGWDARSPWMRGLAQLVKRARSRRAAIHVPLWGPPPWKC